MDKKSKFKELMELIFSPFSVLIGYLKLFSEKLFIYFKDHKEFIIIFTYGVGLLLQSMFLYFSVGIEGLNYLSIKFSILILAILLFFGLLGIPFVFLMVISMFIIVFLGFGWLLAIFVGFLIILQKYFPNLLNGNFSKQIDEKVDRLYLGGVLSLIFVFFLSFFIQFGTPKPIELITEKNGKIMGKLLFYNQDYYFLDNCGEQVIIPEREVNSVHMFCPNLKCKKAKLDSINLIYKNYCDSLIKKNKNKGLIGKNVC